MKRILMNKTDLTVSEICLGADHFTTVGDKNTAFALLDRFVAVGGNFVDTANLYARDYTVGISRSEELLGEYRKARPGVELVIATKGAHHDITTKESRVTRACIAGDLDESLRTLGLDHIDFYWLHRDNSAIPVEEIVDMMEEFVKAGKIRFYGGSNYTLERIRQADAYAKAHGLQGFSGISNHYTPAVELEGRPFYTDPTLVTNIKEELPEAAKLGLAYIPYGSTAKGWFSKSLKGEASERAANAFDHEINRALRSELVKKAEAESIPVQTALLRYMIEQGREMGLQIIPITSCSKKEQLDEVALV